MFKSSLSLFKTLNYTNSYYSYIEIESSLPEAQPCSLRIIESDDDGPPEFTGPNLFYNWEGRQCSNPLRAAAGCHSPAGFQDGYTSDDGANDAVTLSPVSNSFPTHGRVQVGDRSNLANLHRSRSDALASNFTMMDSDDTSNDEEDACHQFRETGITGTARVVYEKAKAELAYKVLYKQPFPDYEETRHLLTDVWKAALSKCKNITGTVKVDRKIKTTVIFF